MCLSFFFSLVRNILIILRTHYPPLFDLRSYKTIQWTLRNKVLQTIERKPGLRSLGFAWGVLLFLLLLLWLLFWFFFFHNVYRWITKTLLKYSNLKFSKSPSSILKWFNDEFSLTRLFCSIFLKFVWDVMFLHELSKLFHRQHALERKF